MNDLPFSEVYWSYWGQVIGIVCVFFGWIASSFLPLINWQYKKAQAYCDVLNKIIWKIPLIQGNVDTTAEYLASQATERLWFKSGGSTYLIVWNTDSDRFELKTHN